MHRSKLFVAVSLAIAGCQMWNPNFRPGDEAVVDGGETLDSGETGGDGVDTESGSSDTFETETAEDTDDADASSDETATTETETDTDTSTDTDTDTDTNTDAETGDQTPSDIHVVFTADNAYGLGYGGELEFTEYLGPIENLVSAEIFGCGDGPEFYQLPGDAEFVYIVAWADNLTSQGVIGELYRESEGSFGDHVATGDLGWEVCATGKNYLIGSGGPALDEIHQQLEICNEGTGNPLTTSGGWVDELGTDLGALAVGEDNTTPYEGNFPVPGNEFPVVCPEQMSAAPRWLWFNWDPDGIQWPDQSPFLSPGGGENTDHKFLIFRFPAAEIPEP